LIAPCASYQGSFVLARHIPLPSFFSTKRAKAITVAVAGTLTLATVISVGAAIASSASPMPATDTAFITTVGQQNAAQTARSAGAVQQADLVDKARALQVQRHAQQVAAAKVAATKAAATKAAATKAAATKAAALKAAAAKAAERKAAAEKAVEQAAAARKAHRAQQTAVTTPSGSPQQIAQQMLGKYGWSQSQFSCLQPLWFHESGWNASAENPSSGAYGIPQALPGSQMASAGADWRTNAATQIRWGLDYIQGRYGSPCGAWAHEQADNWY
jgi:hypothetical protein